MQITYARRKKTQYDIMAGRTDSLQAPQHKDVNGGDKKQDFQNVRRQRHRTEIEAHSRLYERSGVDQKVKKHLL